MQEYIDMWRNYVNFSGRTTVRGFWMATLFQFLANLAIITVSTFFINFEVFGHSPFLTAGTLLTGVFSIASFLPMLSMSIRRLHDINKSGIYYLFGFIPLAGPIIMLIWYCRSGDSAPNTFGPPAPGAFYRS